jgi:ABC-type transport system involved in multi-copper enzyme maturation permease subunit
MNPVSSSPEGHRVSGRLRQLVPIIRITLLEARRTRLLWIILSVVLVFYAGSILVKEVAITESLRFQTGFLATGLRLAAVFMVALYVLASWLRDVNDKVLELMLSLDLPRARYLVGKFAGYSLVALLTALLCSLPIFLLHPGLPAVLWFVSLVLELWIIAALSLFCINSLHQITAAAGFVAAFYLLARSISAIQLMSRSSLLAQNSWEREMSSRLADLFAVLLPGLEGFTQTSWLVDAAPPGSALAGLLVQAAIYIVLLLSAAAFDLRRREL